MAGRSDAREMAAQMLYQTDLNKDIDRGEVKRMIAERLKDHDLAEFSWSLYIGVQSQIKQLDELIASVAKNWKVSRMAVTDRNAVRMGVFEIRSTGTPPKVAVDEAVRIAKKFGGPQSPSFVNGILDQLIPKADVTTSTDVAPLEDASVEDQTEG